MYIAYAHSKTRIDTKLNAKDIYVFALQSGAFFEDSAPNADAWSSFGTAPAAHDSSTTTTAASGGKADLWSAAQSQTLEKNRRQDEADKQVSRRHRWNLLLSCTLVLTLMSLFQEQQNVDARLQAERVRKAHADRESQEVAQRSDATRLANQAAQEEEKANLTAARAAARKAREDQEQTVDLDAQSMTMSSMGDSFTGLLG
jgi:hypothetical protein